MNKPEKVKTEPYNIKNFCNLFMKSNKRFVNLFTGNIRYFY